MMRAAAETGVSPTAAPVTLLERITLVGVLTHAALVPITRAGMQIALAVSLGGLVALALQRRLAWPRGPVVWASLLVVVTAAASVPVAAVFGSPPVEWQKSTSWWVLLSPAIVIAALRAGRWRAEDTAERNALRAMGGWCIGALITGIVAWLQFGFALDPVYALGLRSAPVAAPAPLTPGHYAAVGFFRWYTALAHNLTAPLCLAFALALRAPVSRRFRIVLGAAALAAAAAVVLTVSRAAWGALLVGIVLVVVLLGQSWRRAAALAVVICVAMAAHPGVRARVANLTEREAISDRGVTWLVCVEMVRDRPLTGWGWGNIPSRSEPYWERIAPHFPLHAWCHNSVLTGWAEGGPLLAAAVVGYWLIPAAAFRRRLSGPVLGRAAAAGAIAGLAAMFLNGSLHDIFRSGETMFAFGLALAVAWVLAAPPSGERAERISCAGTRR